MRRNSDERLRSLEREHLNDPSDPVPLQRLARELGRALGPVGACERIRDLWVQEDLEAGDDDFDNLAIGLMPQGDYDPADMDAVLGAVNAMAREFEIADVDEDDMDQDQRNPEWAGRRYHKISGESRNFFEGKFAALFRPGPTERAEAGSRTITITREDVNRGRYTDQAWLITLERITPSLEDQNEVERVENNLLSWAGASGRAVSTWAKKRALAAAGRAESEGPHRGHLVVRSGRNFRSALSTAQATRILGSKATESSEADLYRREVWRTRDGRTLYVRVAHGDLDHELRVYLVTHFTLTEYPYHVKWSELTADFHEERGSATLNLWWGDAEDSHQILIHSWNDEPWDAGDGVDEGSSEQPGELTSLVEDGLLDPGNWQRSAGLLCEEHGLIAIDDGDSRRRSRSRRAT